MLLHKLTHLESKGLVSSLTPLFLPVERAFSTTLRKIIVTSICLTVSSLSQINRASCSPFTQDNLVVTRVGTGAAALTNAGTATFLDEFTTAGSAVQSIALPTGALANQNLVQSGTATAEGALTLSNDGRYLVTGGYAATVGTATVATAAGARVVGRADSAGIIDISTQLTDAYTTNAIRSVASIDGSTFWTGGNGTATTGGVRYSTFGGTTSVLLSSTPTNVRNVNTIGGQLYVSSGSGTSIQVNTVGSGLPITSGQTTSVLAGLTSGTPGSPYDYAMFDLDPTVAGLDTLYLVSDNTSPNNNTVSKYSFNGTTWTARGTLTPGTGTANTLRGITGTVDSSGRVTLYAVRGDTANTIVTLQDSVASAATVSTTTVSGSFTTIATAATNTAFRGIDFAPTTFLSGSNSKIYVGATAPTTLGAGSSTSATFGRVMQSSSPTPQSITVTKAGSDNTSATVTAAVDATTTSPASVDYTSAGASSVSVNLNTASTGARLGTVTLNNRATISAGTSLGGNNGNAVINVSGTVVSQRVVTQQGGSSALGSFIVSTPISGNTTLETTGDNDNRTQVNVTGSAPADGFGASLSGSTTLFDAAADTSLLTFGGSFSTAGPKVNSFGLAVATAENGGAGLSGEGSYANVSVAYSAIALDRSNGSFSGAGDSNSFLIDFGTVLQGSIVPSSPFSIFNLVNTASYTASLDLLSGGISGTGDTGVLTTNVSAFAGLGASSSNPYSASINTTSTGVFFTTYTFAVRDDQTVSGNAVNTTPLTLTIQGTVVAVPEPSSLAMMLFGMLGLWLFRGKRFK